LNNIAPEFRSALAANQYERTPHGIYFPYHRALLRGDAFIGGARVGRNLVTAQGVALIASDAMPATLYMAWFSGNVTPLASWTAANFSSNATEITSTSEGHVEATRPALTSFDGLTPAEFNARTATTLTVYGFGLFTNSTRGGTSGNLFSAMRFSSPPRTFHNLDIVEISYALTVTPL
jgi:hypothetical protein